MRTTGIVCSSAAVSLLVLLQPSFAEPVKYTPPSPIRFYSEYGPSWSITLDIDSNGTIDLQLAKSWEVYNHYMVENTAIQGISTTFVQVESHPETIDPVWVTAYSLNDWVGPTSTSVTYGCLHRTFYREETVLQAGHFQPSGGEYMGFRFAAADGNHWAWLQFEYPSNGAGFGDDMRVKSWGYETTPSTAIRVGVPEPTSMALLLCGLLGVLRFTSRRRG